MSGSHRSAWLWHLGAALVFTALGGLALAWRGPIGVVSSPTAIDHEVPFGYMISAFPYYGALWGEVGRQRREASARVLAFQLLVVGFLATARLLFFIPVSGHILLMVFVALEAARLQPLQLRLALLLPALGGLAWMLHVKIGRWHDVTTPAWGALLGALVFALGVAWRMRPSTPHASD